MAILESESSKAFQQPNELSETGLLLPPKTIIGFTTYQEQSQINLLCNFHLFGKLNIPHIHRKALRTCILREMAISLQEEFMILQDLTALKDNNRNYNVLKIIYLKPKSLHISTTLICSLNIPKFSAEKAHHKILQIVPVTHKR